jgi:O-antigen/teichoic acid export membrane protein
LDLGVGGAVTKYVAELRARGRPDEASDLIATALGIYCVLGVVVVVASVPLAFIAPDLFHIKPELQAKAHWVILLTGVALAVQLPATAAYAVLRGLQRFHLNNMIGIAATLVQAAATVVILSLGGGVVGLAAIALPLKYPCSSSCGTSLQSSALDCEERGAYSSRRLRHSAPRFSSSTAPLW